MAARIFSQPALVRTLPLDTSYTALRCRHSTSFEVMSGVPCHVLMCASVGSRFAGVLSVWTKLWPVMNDTRFEIGQLTRTYSMQALNSGLFKMHNVIYAYCMCALRPSPVFAEVSEATHHHGSLVRLASRSGHGP